MLSLRQLQDDEAFSARHIGPSMQQQHEMLSRIGVKSLSELMGEIIPTDIQLPAPPAVDEAATEDQALQELLQIARQNQCHRSYIGMGYTATLLPPVIQRNVLENPSWYTAYTPYQPEISQGRLEALLNFQQMTQDLTGLELASASLLDEDTAAAEAMAMAHRCSKNKKATRFFIADDVHPQTLDVVKTRAHYFGFELIIGAADTAAEQEDLFGALFQYCGTSGELHDYRTLLTSLKAKGVICCMAADIMALVLLEAPGKLGAHGKIVLICTFSEYIDQIK